MKQTIISEALGKNRSVELDPDTGEVTILDAQAGITLSALQVLVLEGFLSENQKSIFVHAFVPINERAGGIA